MVYSEQQERIVRPEPTEGVMIKFLAALRNVMVVVVLSWLGFSEKPADNDRRDEANPVSHFSLLAR